MIDASVAFVAAGLARSDVVVVLTSDPDDVTTLLDLLGSKARVVTV